MLLGIKASVNIARQKGPQMTASAGTVNATFTFGPSGYVPVQTTKDRGALANPKSAAAVACALRTVLLHSLAEAFDLREEETIYAGVALDEALASLLDLKAHTVPFAVRQEMLDGSYTRLLELRSKAKVKRANTQFDARLGQPSLSEWVEALMAPIETSYDLRPSLIASMRGFFATLLSELGIGDKKNPRAAAFVPADIRARLFADRSRQK